MKSNKVLAAGLVGAALAFSAPAAFAQARGAAADAGWYVGGSFGKTEDNESCPTTSCDLKDSGWKIFGGWRMNRNLAFEGAYTDWGSFKAGGTFGGLPANVNVDVTGLSASAVGILPLGGGSFDLFGKAGLSFTKYDGSGSVGGFSGSGRDDETELLWGVGATYHFTRNLGVRAEFERLNKSEVDMMSIGVQYRF